MALNRLSLALAATALAASAALAQHPMPHPPPPRPFFRPLPRQQLLPDELQLTAQKATVQIGNASARVQLQQTFRNPQARAIEGTYLWSVPPGAAISDLSVTMNGKKLGAEILDADQARDIYQNIVRQRRDPAILEFVGRDLVRARIFPVPANGAVEVELTYSQPLAGNRFALPFRVPDSADLVDGALDLTFTNPDIKAIYSPSHPVEISRGSQQTRVSGEWKTDRDFTLGWTRGDGAVGLDLLTFHKPGEADGYFMLLAAPDARAGEKQIVAKDVTFVFDTSGSMNDDGKIEQARRALATLLASLGTYDRFNIITFASDVRPFRDAVVPATPDNLSAARAFVEGIKAVGGTNIEAALSKTFAPRIVDGVVRPNQVIFLTDGLPTVGETKIETLLDQAKRANDGAARIWTLGVGFDVNTRLLDGLASENGGDSDYVLPREDIETKVGALYQKIAYPVLTDVRLDFGGLETYEGYPRRFPDLFRGEQMIVMGRFKGTPKSIGLSGQLNGVRQHYAGQISAGGDELPRLWATRKVGFLLDDARRAGRPLDGEVRAEILQISAQYGVVTPLTAALITEDGRPMVDIRGGIFRDRNSLALRGATGLSGAAGASDFAAQTGAGAVAASKSIGQLQKGEAAPIAVAGTKVLGGHTFVLRGEVWTDGAFDAAKFPNPQVVKFGSDAYFGLLADAQVAQWLSAGEQVVFVRNGVAVRVEK